MGISRVTQSMLADRSVGSLQGSLTRLAKIQEQLSTGKVVNRASDSPTAAGAAMRFRGSIADQQQYVRNAENGLGWLSAADTTLSSVSDSVRRARELALQGVSASSSPTARAALAAEVDQLREQALADANTGYLGRPVFGGVTAGGAAYDATGSWVGAPGAVNRTVGAGVQVRVDVPGPDVFGDGATSLFAELDALSTALTSGDEAGMRAGLDALATRLTTVATVQAGVGAAYNRIEAAVESAKGQVVSLSASLSEIENTDLPKAMVDLKLQEVAYQAALASTSRVMQPSLVDFLR